MSTLKTVRNKGSDMIIREHPNCEGCRSMWVLEDNYVCVLFLEDQDNCPCSICLVKIMCTKMCDEMKLFKPRLTIMRLEDEKRK